MSGACAAVGGGNAVPYPIWRIRMTAGRLVLGGSAVPPPGLNGSTGSGKRPLGADKNLWPQYSEHYGE